MVLAFGYVELRARLRKKQDVSMKYQEAFLLVNAPRVGLEPTANRLTAERSTIELPRKLEDYTRFAGYKQPLIAPIYLPCRIVE